MRICVIGSSKKFFSGISAYTIVMANAFAEQGHQVSVVLLRNLVPLFLYPGRERVGKGEYIMDFRPDVTVYNGMDWNAPASWFKARRFLARQNPEVIIMHWWTSSVVHMQLVLAACRRLNGLRSKLILEMHEVVDTLEEKILPIRVYSRVGGRALLRGCDGYTAHSEEARQAMIRTYQLAEDKIDVIPHGPYEIYGTPDRGLARKEMDLDGFTVLCFGLIRQYKGVSLLVRAFNTIPPGYAANMHLVIAGEDWGDDTELRPELERSPYRDRIIFRPEFIPDERVPKLFAASDVVALPYLRTCGSGVIHIAVAQGKPVITADLDTMSECLQDYGGARFFPAGNVDALRDRLLEAYHNWVVNGVQTYQFTGMSWEAIVKKYEDIIEEMDQRQLG
ncbi:glycosyl transferase group 1 [Syntrophobotulus glycolicus DSM 8271]|uniref:Glycosyl transferase group 1 n=1 Tax=Syntrophobotulus glycolicus (strain DSM 8271 / FlGlyR) TaxID=645991 RepID=F0T1U3_SYNGF|nr:glycosyltransferase family 4 protein [Syntrophobotulus glycolicus]ADY55207.1 glycosyl transferase group 1 [Syntrophobotulus glycolicus DSM 8271]